MLEVIEKLLLLQERDRQISQVEAELGDIDPHRRLAREKLESAKARSDALRLLVKQLESERDRLDVDVRERKTLIEKYTLQQFQTKKNPEYQALAHEILTCRTQIDQIEDKELEILVQIDTAQAQVSEAAAMIQEMQRETEERLATFAERDKNLRSQLADLIRGRNELAAAVDGGMLPRYERLRKAKGHTVVVGVEHGVCGGCHMKIPAQIVVGCQADQQVMLCPNCGRVLYYAPGMDLAVAE